MTKSATLYCQNADSDKEYRLSIEPQAAGYVVNFAYGARGATLRPGTKTPAPVSLAEAQKVFDRLLREKTGKGYVSILCDAQDTLYRRPNTSAPTAYPVELLTEVTQAEAITLAESVDYLMQEKRDGHRRQIRKRGGELTGYNRRGLPVPVPAEMAGGLAHANFLIDGEIEGDLFVAFDLLEFDFVDLTQTPYAQRFAMLRKLLTTSQRIRPVRTWAAPVDKVQAMAELLLERAEGVVFKLASAKYQPGRSGQHKKFKFVTSCTAQVTAVRPDGKESATVALWRSWNRTWIDVGHVSLIGKPPVKVGDLIEVRYLYATKARRLVQAVYLQNRTGELGYDDCSITQLKFKQGVE